MNNYSYNRFSLPGSNTSLVASIDCRGVVDTIGGTFSFPGLEEKEEKPNEYHCFSINIQN